MMVTDVSSESVARGYLQISGGSVERAIQTYYDSPELASSFNDPPAVPAASSHQPASSSRSRSIGLTGREDASGVIHIDSDDDDVPMTEEDDDDDNDDVAAIARNAQEEEDAAMARRLQEELYGSGSGAAEDGIRAPIAQTTETLAGPDPSWRGIHDDREAAVLEQLRARQSRQQRQSMSLPAVLASVY